MSDVPEPPSVSTDNTIGGDVIGPVVQAGTTGPITINYQPDARSSKATGRTWNIPARNPNFTGRDDLFSQVHHRLHADAAVTVHSLRGMGGVGKTQLATEYPYRYVDEYDVAWWVPAEQPELVPTYLARLGTALGLARLTDVTAMAERVVAVLRDRSGWLLVFDNAEDPDAVRPYLPGSSGHVLITTRRTGFTSLGSVLDVDVLSRNESTTFLRHRVPTLTEEQASELAERLGKLPLALEQAAAYLESTALPVEEYLNLLAERDKDMLRAGAVIGYEHTLATVWNVSLDRVRERCPAAIELLKLCAWLAPEDIPLDLFACRLDGLPADLAVAAADPITWANTVGILVEYALARRAGHMISLHRLLQTAMRQEQDSTVVLDLLFIDPAGDTVDTLENWPRWRQLLPHMIAATRHTHSPFIDDMLDGVRQSLRLIALRPDPAHPLRQRPDPRSFDPFVQALECLGALAEDLDYLDFGLRLRKRALAIAEAVQGPDHPYTRMIRFNLENLIEELGQEA